MELTLETLDEFKTLTGKDVAAFFLRAINFFNGSGAKIMDLYGGKGTADKGAFEEFDNLERECEDFLNAFHQLRNGFTNLKWWDVLDQIEQIDSRLMTLRNMNKWSRSSLTNFGYDPSFQATYSLQPNQSLEKVSGDVLGNNNPEDDWEAIALANSLREEDYTTKGGVNLQLTFPKINKGTQVESVVDVMQGLSIYGKDIYRKIQFANDDLTTLGYRETIAQSVNILINLKKNDNPSSPTDGLQKELTIGGNRALLNFPVIQRQLSEAFATDDTLQNFNITTINVVEDTLNIEFTVETRLGQPQEGSVVV
jgi:hypothetical protein